jgi:hypothetical protein
MRVLIAVVVSASLCGACARQGDRQAGRVPDTAAVRAALGLPHPGLPGRVALGSAPADTAAMRALRDSLAAYERRRAARR